MRWFFAFLMIAAATRAQELREVDLELFLAVDVSRSMAPFELEIQRQGYAEALASDDVIAAIQGGLIGEIAVTYVEWAGWSSQKVVVPWTVIDGRDTANAVAQIVLVLRPQAGTRPRTREFVFENCDMFAKL